MSTEYVIDSSHSHLGFSVRHLVSKVRGSFEKFEGVIRLPEDDLSRLQAEVTIDTASITTSEPSRDEHLRTADFFQVDEYPQITFKSREVRDVKDNHFTLVGDFTLRGVTKTIELDAEYTGSAVDPWGKQRIAFEGKTRINRKDYGLNWNAALEAGGFLVGDVVDLSLEVEATVQEEVHS